MISALPRSADRQFIMWGIDLRRRGDLISKSYVDG